MDNTYFLNLEYIYNKIYQLFFGTDLRALRDWFVYFVHRITPLSIIASIVFVLCTAYLLWKIAEVRAREGEKLKVVEATHGTATMENKKWLRVSEHINSNNPSDWRLAIMEADIMLEEMLDKMGYAGETIGDKLKKIEKSDFTSIDAAWEAHRVRNQIAHEGADFSITEREAKRVIDLFKKAFEEFHYL